MRKISYFSTQSWILFPASSKLPPEKFAKKDEDSKQSPKEQQQPDLPTEPKKVQLNSGDELFSVIRDRNFHAVGPELSRRAKILSAQYEVRLAITTLLNPLSSSSKNILFVKKVIMVAN